MRRVDGTTSDIVLAEQRYIAITTGLFVWCLEVWRYGGAGGFNLRLTEPTGFKGVNDRTVQFYSAVQMTVKILISTICLQCHYFTASLGAAVPRLIELTCHRLQLPFVITKLTGSSPISSLIGKHWSSEYCHVLLL